jgi:hypothetical protein
MLLKIILQGITTKLKTNHPTLKPKQKTFIAEYKIEAARDTQAFSQL